MSVKDGDSYEWDEESPAQPSTDQLIFAEPQDSNREAFEYSEVQAEENQKQVTGDEQPLLPLEEPHHDDYPEGIPQPPIIEGSQDPDLGKPETTEPAEPQLQEEANYLTPSLEPVLLPAPQAETKEKSPEHLPISHDDSESAPKQFTKQHSDTSSMMFEPPKSTAAGDITTQVETPADVSEIRMAETPFDSPNWSKRKLDHTNPRGSPVIYATASPPHTGDEQPAAIQIIKPQETTEEAADDAQAPAVSVEEQPSPTTLKSNLVPEVKRRKRKSESPDGQAINNETSEEETPRVQAGGSSKKVQLVEEKTQPKKVKRKSSKSKLKAKSKSKSRSKSKKGTKKKSKSRSKSKKSKKSSKRTKSKSRKRSKSKVSSKKSSSKEELQLPSKQDGAVAFSFDGNHKNQNATDVSDGNLGGKPKKSPSGKSKTPIKTKKQTDKTTPVLSPSEKSSKKAQGTSNKSSKQSPSTPSTPSSNKKPKSSSRSKSKGKASKTPKKGSKEAKASSKQRSKSREASKTPKSSNQSKPVVIAPPNASRLEKQASGMSSSPISSATRAKTPVIYASKAVETLEDDMDTKHTRNSSKQKGFLTTYGVVFCKFQGIARYLKEGPLPSSFVPKSWTLRKL